MSGFPSGTCRRGWPLVAAVPLVLAAFLYAQDKPAFSEQSATVVPRSALADPHPTVAIAKGKDYAKTVMEAVRGAGGLEGLVHQGSKVFIKVNIVNAAPSGGGKVTDWRVAQAVVDECRRLGAAEVVIGETPVDGSGMAGFAAAGYKAVKGAVLMETNVTAEDCRYVTPERSVLGQPMYLPKAYLDADAVISIPVMKTHGAAGVTMGLKNMGIGMPPTRLYTTKRGGKWALHDLGMNKVITEVNLIRKPDFTIIDGMVAGEGEGPNNPTPVVNQVVIASRDVVAADTIGAMAMGINPDQVTHIVYAAAHGVGVKDPGAIRVVGKPLKDIRKDFERPGPYGHPYKRSTVVVQAPTDAATDGDLAEWSGAWSNRVADDSQFPYDSGRKGWRDLSARTMVMHDLNNIHFAFKVTDDAVIKPKAFTGVWEQDGDGIELLLGFDMPFLEDEPAKLKTRDKPAVGKDFVLLAGFSDKPGTLLNAGTGKPVAGSRVVFAKSADGYTVEGMLPLSALGRRALREREEFWIDFGVADADKAGETPIKAMWNEATGMQYESPALLGRAYVEPLAPGSVPVSNSEVKAPMHPFIAKVNASTPPSGEISLFWIGQAGYVIKGAGKTVYIDPYLSDSCGAEYRIFPLPVGPEAVTNADYVLSSHPHADHYDDLTIPPMMDASPNATLILNDKVRGIKADTLSDGALKRVTTVKVGQRIDLGNGVSLDMVQAKHDQFTDPQTGYQNLGFILDFGGLTVYHTGDSLYFPAMAANAKKALGDRKLDVLLVPINGKWGNMNHLEAVRLTTELKPALSIPMHYGTLSNNTVEPDIYTNALRAADAGQAYRVLEPNGEFVYARK